MLRGVISMAGTFGVALGLMSPACTSPTCSDKIAAMRAALAQVPDDAWSSVPLYDRVLFERPLSPLPQASRGERVRSPGRLVYVDRDGLVHVKGSPDWISGAQLVAEAPAMLSGGEPALYMFFDPEVSLAPHRGWLMDLAKIAQLRVLVRVPTPDPPRTPGGEAALTIVHAELTPKCSTRGRVPECGPVDRVGILTENMRRSANGCESLTTGLAAIAAAEPERRQKLVVDTVIAGAEACGCDTVNVEAIATLAWLLLMGDDPGLRWLPLQLDRGARRLIHADATAEEMAAILVEESHLGFAPH